MYQLLIKETFFFIIYGFLGWLIEALYYSTKERKFINTGFLTFPIDFEIGLTISSLIIDLSQMGRHYFLIFFLIFARLIIIKAIFAFISSRVTKNIVWLRRNSLNNKETFFEIFLLSVGCWIAYLVLQPFLLIISQLIPVPVHQIISIIFWIIIIIDLIIVVISINKGQKEFNNFEKRSMNQRVFHKISLFVWGRLEKAYPGIKDEKNRDMIVFGKGLSLDKLIWIFLISSLLGDLIETLWCGLVDGVWMTRSSVVFGPFSLVWGIGAVVLTLTLIPLKDKNDRWIMLLGGLLGGAFEYTCSIFTEIVFGRVFWDYSGMPLNIHGRTNILFMFFWAALSLIWVKLIYPPLERLIEKFPLIKAEIITWIIVIFMTFNSLFTLAVISRYNQRQKAIAPKNSMEQFIDNAYDNRYIEHRWQNMKDADKIKKSF